MTRDLEPWHRAAADQADEVFDEKWMAAQRRGIQQRLGAMVPARVLPFPVPGDVRAARAACPRRGGRAAGRAWPAPASSASCEMPDPVSSSARRARRARTLAPGGPVRETSADAADLEDIDLALLRPRTAVAELRALDEFTPHVRDIVAPRR